MKKAYVIIPLVMLAVFSSYYFHWKRKQEAVRELYTRDPYVGRSGLEEAAADLVAGRPRYLIFGEPDWEQDTAARQQLQKVGITLQRVTGCEITQPLFSYVSSYNAEITRAFSKETIQAAFRTSAGLAQKRANKAPEPTP